mgnify:CR=1 FL=1
MEIFKDSWFDVISNNITIVFNIIFNNIKSFWKCITTKDSNGDSWLNLFLTGIIFVIFFWFVYSIF